MQRKITFQSLIIWHVALLFFIFECFLRVYPNTLADNLMASLNINAEQFSWIGSGFFFTYAAMQIPVGALLHRYGPRILLTISCLSCAIGVLIFSFSYSLYVAIFARLFMGLGSSFAFISLLVITLNWFPKSQFTFFSGLSQFLGSIGPLLAGAPLALALDFVDGNWRMIFFYLFIFTLILSFLIFLIVRNKPRNTDQIIFLEPKRELKKPWKLFKNLQIWWIILYTGLIYSSMPILGTFWCTLFLQTKGFEKSKAALMTSMIWIGFAFASPLVGKLSDWTKRRVPTLALCAFIGIVCSGLFLYYPTNNEWILIILLIGIGVASSAQILSFAITTENVRKENQSLILGINNMMLMLAGAIIPTICGFWIHTEKHAGKLNYTSADFVRGLSLMPILYLICFLIALFGIKETFCRSQYEIHPLD